MQSQQKRKLSTNAAASNEAWELEMRKEGPNRTRELLFPKTKSQSSEAGASNEAWKLQRVREKASQRACISKSED